jgi:hypothetical protein
MNALRTTGARRVASSASATAAAALPLSISKDRNKFCWIALTNPTEVIIEDGWSSGGVDVRNNALKVYGV